MEEHPDFKKPSNLSARIWRYVDFTKFISILETSSLWFSKVDKLGDPFEASLLPYVRPECRLEVGVSLARPEILDVLQREMSATIAVNCWHMNEYESAAMWRLYTQAGEGIAIQSTFSDFAECLTDCPLFANIGCVTYIDYAAQAFPRMVPSCFAPVMHKRKSFEHEREVRAVVWTRPGSPSGQGQIDGDGVAVAVDIERLIRQVYVSPTAPPYVWNLVKAVVQRYGLSVEVVQSDLLRVPLV